MLLGAAALARVEAQSFAAWSHHASVALNTTATGANVAADVPGFPVAVSLNQGNFDFTQAQPNGADVRFADASGASLPYEIEAWDAAAKKAAVWVKTDVKGNDKSQAFTMYWGNAAATSESDGKKVFAKADGWTSVWHLAEQGSTAAGNYKDASDNAQNGTGINITGAATGDGRVGPAALLAHTSGQYIRIPGSETSPLYQLNAQATYSIWVYAKSHTVEYQAMFSKGESGFRIHYYGIDTWDENKGKHITETCLDPGDQCAPPKAGAGVDVAPNKWWHLALLHKNKQEQYYINGVMQSSAGVATVTSGAEFVAIGNNGARGRSFDGFVDEARISSVGRDANWIKLEYESQKEGSAFVQIGSATTGAIDAKLSGRLPGGFTGIRRFDVRGRLAASVRASGDMRADLAELGRGLPPGLYWDEYLGNADVTVKPRQIVLP